MSSQLFENTVCLAVTFHRIGRHRRVKQGEVEVVKRRKDDEFPEDGWIDQSMLSVGKEILRSDHHHKAVRIDQEFDGWVSKRAVPCPLKRGTYLIPVKMLDEVYEKLDEAQQNYLAEADALLAEYEGLKRMAKDRLKGLWREQDYPSPQTLRRKFWVERKLFDFSPPGESKLSSAVYEQERDRWQRTFAEAEEEVRSALRESLAKLVGHLAERLEPAADGKKKRLHESAVDKVVEFLELFDKRNVLNDEELKKIVERARRVLDGDPFMVDALRQDGGIRDAVREQMERIGKSLEALITSGPRRVVSFEED